MVTHAPANIEAFQDLAIWLDSHTPGEVRDALASQATSPWRHAPEREHHDSLHIEAEYFAFELEAQGDTPKVGLVLWKDEGQLRVTNVVPVDTVRRQLPWPVDDNYLGRLRAEAGLVREVG